MEKGEKKREKQKKQWRVERKGEKEKTTRCRSAYQESRKNMKDGKEGNQWVFQKLFKWNSNVQCIETFYLKCQIKNIN